MFTTQCWAPHVLNEADSKTCFTEKDPENSGEKIVCSFAGVYKGAQNNQKLDSGVGGFGSIL